MDISHTLTIVKSRVRSTFYRWCRALGWSQEIIEDWVEEVSGEGICLVLKSLQEGESLEQGRFHAFCVNKAKSLARDELLKASNQVKAEAGYLENSQDRELADPILTLLERLNLTDLLQNLSEMQREVIALYCVAHLSVREISGLLKVPEKTIYTHLRRARLRLTEMDEERKSLPTVRPPPLDTPPHLNVRDLP